MSVSHIWKSSESIHPVNHAVPATWLNSTTRVDASLGRHFYLIYEKNAIYINYLDIFSKTYFF